MQKAEEAHTDHIRAKSHEMLSPNKWLGFFLWAKAEGV